MLKVIKNIFHNGLYLSILSASLILVFVAPMLGMKVIVPYFYEQMMFNILDEATRVANHLTRYHNTQNEMKHFYNIKTLQNDFQIEKIKLFDSNGTIRFATEAKDVGTKNKNSYFYNNVAKGEIFYKVVNKGTSTFEGRIVDKDVAEVYVPIMDNGIFQGALEIYYDVTKRRENFNILVQKVNQIYVSMAILFLVFVLFMLYIASKTNLQKLEEIEKNKQKDMLLLNQSKLAAMGEMIGNIAHHWRQPLSAISTLSSGIKIEKEFGVLKDEDLIKYCDNITKQTQFLSKTIDDFRSFIAPDKSHELCDLKNIIIHAVSLSESFLSSCGIKVIVDLQQNIKVVSYPNELIQSMLNIINNSNDVLQKIEGEKYIFIKLYLENGTARIVFQDNGGGIDEEVIDRVFEPYFTTKHQSQGTGLGLYMVREVIKKHCDGNVYIENSSFEYNEQVFSGAKVTIELTIT